ncbi:MAG TPA: transporter substrate-binding domain-containing protein [Chryseolinea sp.]|nr:transporter substrate-binding domain-containing protein [Chryseolinea sp.]
MKAFSKLFATAGLVLICFSCEKTPDFPVFREPQVDLDVDAIVKRGYINALVDNNSFSYFIYKGHPIGYEYELLQLLAKQLNVALKIKVTSGVETAIEQLNLGECDIIAFPLTVTKTTRKYVEFSRPHYNTYPVLVQRKPENWRKLSLDEINNNLIRDPVDLIGKQVYVMEGSSHLVRLQHLSEELGGDIIIATDSLTAESESLIRRVALGEIDYTVSDHIMARVNSAYYPNLDISTVLNVPQQVAWGMRKNAPNLKKAIDDWLTAIKQKPTFMVIYNKYFRSPRTALTHLQSDYSSLGGNKLSPYDEMIQAGAAQLGWDWRLLASVVYQESKFDPVGESWAGARGLMQLMPETAKRFGATNVNDPSESLKAGVKYLAYLQKYWTKRIKNPDDRIKFILASYNTGLSHILDARKLCVKYKRDETSWANVEEFLLKKSDPKYYRDPVVVTGYCKCEEPVNYVREILARYEEYKIHISPPLFDEEVVGSLTSAK